jgi:hypothetical protein
MSPSEKKGPLFWLAFPFVLGLFAYERLLIRRRRKQHKVNRLFRRLWPR